MSDPLHATDDPSGNPALAGADNVAALIAERDRYLDVARRTRAEFENYQKRVARDFENDRKYAPLPLIKELLPILDNLDRAIASARDQGQGVTGVIEGVDIVRKHLYEVLAKHGVAAIQVQGIPFDPNLHEAVMQRPSNDVPPMTVLETVQTGFRFHDRVVRPAQVIVSVAPSS